MKLKLFSLPLFLLPLFYFPWNTVDQVVERVDSPTLVCNLPAPTFFTGTMTSSTTASLSWESVSGAYGYTLIVTDNGIPILQTEITGTSTTLSGLVTGHIYNCIIATKCDPTQTSGYIICNDILP